MDMVAQIKNEVRKICTRDNICSHITANEGTEEKQANIQRMINLEAENLKVRLFYMIVIIKVCTSFLFVKYSSFITRTQGTL